MNRTPEESQSYREQLTKENEGNTILSILIATTKDRRGIFVGLMQMFSIQIEMGGFKGPDKETWIVERPALKEDGSTELNEIGEPYMLRYKSGFVYPDKVEVLFEEDDKEISIGAKRQKLLERATAEYIVFFDSDDVPKPNYINEIMKALESKPDCVGFKIDMTTNGVARQTCIHSLSNSEWYSDGDIHYRNCTHFNPVKKSIALQVGFEDLRYGEDKIYSDKISKLCKHEVFIDNFLFDYRYSTAVPHKEKYGI